MAWRKKIIVSYYGHRSDPVKDDQIRMSREIVCAKYWLLAIMATGVILWKKVWKISREIVSMLLAIMATGVILWKMTKFGCLEKLSARNIDC